jgi:predicted Zn-dependent peptidase
MTFWGSSFRSRLFNDVRTKRGLAYSVGSRLNSGVCTIRSVWLMQPDEGAIDPKEVIALSRGMERMRIEVVTDGELAKPKRPM